MAGQRVPKKQVDPSRTPLPNGPIPKSAPIPSKTSDKPTGSTSIKHTAPSGSPVKDSPVKKAKVETESKKNLTSTAVTGDNGGSAIKGHQSKIHQNLTNASDPIKHTPYFPQGLKFSWKDNAHLDYDFKWQVGDNKSPDELQFSLVDVNGKSWKVVYTRRHEMDWANTKDVGMLNTWRRQFLDRRLNHNNDGLSKITDYRNHWTVKEKEFLEALVKHSIRKSQRSPNVADWNDIAEKFNARFDGKFAKTGARRAPGLDPGNNQEEEADKESSDGETSAGEEEAVGKKEVTSKNVVAGQQTSLTKPAAASLQESQPKTLSRPHQLYPREMNAMRTQLRRWPDSKEMMQAELKAAKAAGKATEGTQDSELEEDPKDEDDDEIGDMAISQGLEEESDDESDD
ncbi:hypothetical protein EG329_009652 [Mollisiaceae sp. DMI_Dod_QoI]|nr:hypothetical protein EG329_009652 [Helotiales sp. DMI_Dod_QoI]